MDDWRHCRDHGIDFFGSPSGCPLCVAFQAIAVRDEELARLKRETEDLRKLYTEEKARADKRERQLVWLSDGLDPVCIAGSFYYGATGEIKYDGTPEGLLAAIDEACPEEETR